MAWIDISLPIGPGLTTFPGDPQPYVAATSRALETDSSSFGQTFVAMGSHTGTHVDAPSHFVPGGASVDEIPLDLLCGPAVVLDLSDGPEAIDDDALAERGVEGAERVLLKTSNGALLGHPYTEGYAHLTEGGARYLRSQGVRLLGIDYLSVERSDGSSFPVHHALLDGDRPTIIVEGLDLRGTRQGRYDLVVLPLRLAGCDGAPARAAVRPCL